MIHYAPGMATNTNTTHTPGTVNGTARVTTTELRPGMIIRFSGDKGRSAYRTDIERTELRGTALILSVTSELREGNGRKRARFYLVSLVGGRTVALAPAARHNVSADSTGAPILEPMDHVDDMIAGENARRWAATTDAARAKVERYGRQLDEHDLGHLVDDCMENVTDELGPEPTWAGTVESATWWSHLALMIWSEADGRGVNLDDLAPAPAPRTVAAETGPVLTLVLKDHTTQASLF